MHRNVLNNQQVRCAAFEPIFLKDLRVVGFAAVAVASKGLVD